MISIISGLIGGFILGLILVKYLLRGKTAQELRMDKDLHKKYGTLVWFIALTGAGLGFLFKAGVFSNLF